MRLVGVVGVIACILSSISTVSLAGSGAAQIGPRPFFLVDQLEEGELKTKLQSCFAGPFKSSDFSIGHRGASLQFPEHTRESYAAAARMGAGLVECDVTFTSDRALVCRHSQCDLQRTTNILEIPALAAKCSEPFVPADRAAGRKASAKCCVSDLTLSEFRQLSGKMDAANPWAETVEEYIDSTPSWRTDLYSHPGQLMTLDENIAYLEELGVKHIPELKSPAVSMPYDGDFSMAHYAQAMIDAYKRAGVPPKDVYPQSFDLDVIRYWLQNEPDYGKQAVYLDGRAGRNGFDPNDPQTWLPSMESLYADGLRIIAPPLWVLLTVGPDGNIVPSAYARAAKSTGLDIVTWTLERSGSMSKGGGWYYQSIKDKISKDSDMLVVLDVLAKDVGVRGVFSDWPATTTFYANCAGLD
ncbi:glycerophosphodiester phosphodiesterase family protein [Aestuariispira ectoiniformans]|uniref:glycerophosphodiester phosphodiesterase family protein n=1 Tax=Aestuariispira ectoiniformans TaxID=2775080 RepID=UPI00223B0197|nr:glycerophosphodiester phosphodiesterase family protein [Aestuariispira ectoiniformans]